jgi:Ca2+-binding RTX toxin-like protein
MAILGNAARNLINLNGKFNWNGTAWVKISAAGATSAADSISGFGDRDILYGAGGNDIIHGNDGNDSLYGGSGNDNLFGDAGNDWMSGGLGADAFVGGAGNDTFSFKALNESAADAIGRYIGGAGDVIRDFTSTADSAQHDMIDLRGMAASIKHALTWSAAGPKAYGLWSGNYAGNTYLSVDGTGDAVADFVVKFGSIEKLAQSDFFLI